MVLYGAHYAHYQLWLAAQSANPCTSLAPAPSSTPAAYAMVLPVV